MSAGESNLHYPRVVLVTGASRFLGGYLAARLVQNPMINRVIAAVDAAKTRSEQLGITSE
ncbi:Putative UDP-glucose 4-epimerase GalE1 [Mycobacteroides abscessus]|nr:Putative UDP-glucose 4-epimerase GalE1 [Mycobacteroides abscessus]